MRALLLGLAFVAITVVALNPFTAWSLPALAAPLPGEQSGAVAAPQPSPPPQGVAAYMCPMHPDVMTTEPGKCPRCNMDLVPGSPLALPDFRLHVETTPRVIKAGQPTKFRFTIRHPLTDAVAHEFLPVHDKLFHLFVISRDMEEFAHIHPQSHADGSFTIEHTLPKAGHYVLFSDFLPAGGGSQISATPIVTAGVEADIVAARAKLTPDASWSKSADGVKVELLNDRATVLGGEEVDFLFKFTDAAIDTPTTDLERYLGAFGHLLILSEDMTEYVHAHPREEIQPDPSKPLTGGPEVLFDALLPKPGKYRAWLQFQRNGKLTTVPFTFAAPRAGETQP